MNSSDKTKNDGSRKNSTKRPMRQGESLHQAKSVHPAYIYIYIQIYIYIYIQMAGRKNADLKEMFAQIVETQVRAEWRNRIRMVDSKSM